MTLVFCCGLTLDYCTFEWQLWASDERRAGLFWVARPNIARRPGYGPAGTGSGWHVSAHTVIFCLNVYTVINFVIIHVN